MNKNKIVSLIVVGTVLTSLLFSGCGKKDENKADAVVAEVEDALSGIDDDSPAANNSDTDSNTVDDKKEEKDKTEKETEDVSKIEKDDKTADNKFVENPFLGYKSTSTKYDIKYTFQADSGIAGFTWGSDSIEEGSYYLWAFDLMDEFPKLYTCYREPGSNGKEDYVLDEVYTNLDMMYPEMSMFTDSEHYIEIVVDGTQTITYLDSVEVARITLREAKTIGYIGTWVLDGKYTAYFDDLFIAEGVKGDGDWLYSEDFSGKLNIFNPYLKNENGRLRAGAGYVTVPDTTK